MCAQSNTLRLLFNISFSHQNILCPPELCGLKCLLIFNTHLIFYSIQVSWLNSVADEVCNAFFLPVNLLCSKMISCASNISLEKFPTLVDLTPTRILILCYKTKERNLREILSWPVPPGLWRIDRWRDLKAKPSGLWGKHLRLNEARTENLGFAQHGGIVSVL